MIRNGFPVNFNGRKGMAHSQCRNVYWIRPINIFQIRNPIMGRLLFNQSTQNGSKKMDLYPIRSIYLIGKSKWINVNCQYVTPSGSFIISILFFQYNFIPSGDLSILILIYLKIIYVIFEAWRDGARFAHLMFTNPPGICMLVLNSALLK